MKTVNIATSENTATFFVDIHGDIHDHRADAVEMGLAGTVTVNALYVGSTDQQREAALEAYRVNSN